MKPEVKRVYEQELAQFLAPGEIAAVIAFADGALRLLDAGLIGDYDHALLCEIAGRAMKQGIVLRQQKLVA